MIINDDEVTLNITKNDFKSINYIVITSERTGVSYVDDISPITNQYIEPYFENYFETKSKEPNKINKSKCWCNYLNCIWCYCIHNNLCIL